MIIANDDLATTPAATPVTVNILANDTKDGVPPVTLPDLQGLPTITLPPSNGTATVNPNGTVTYTPNPGFCGTDTFEYEIETAPPPVNLSPPAISGTLLVGDTLTATPGVWDGADTVTGEWYVNGDATGNTSLVYVIHLADAGKAIEYVETAVNPAGAEVQASNTLTAADLTANVEALFANGEQGAWYDPSDFSTMFQDSAGTTPVTAVGQSVGRILDKSGRGNHATQANLSNKPLLQIDGNGKYYLAFDGVDDSLSTASIDFTSTDKMTVVAGVRKLSDAAPGLLAELSTNTNTNAGSFYLVNGDTGNRLWASLSRGDASSAPEQCAWDTTAAPDTAVLAITHDIAGDLSRLRRNGVVGNDGTGDKGTGNFGNHLLFIGLRADTLVPFNGHLYQLIVRGALTADLAPIEAFTADKTGVTL